MYVSDDLFVSAPSELSEPKVMGEGGFCFPLGIMSLRREGAGKGSFTRIRQR